MYKLLFNEIRQTDLHLKLLRILNRFYRNEFFFFIQDMSKGMRNSKRCIFDDFNLKLSLMKKYSYSFSMTWAYFSSSFAHDVVSLITYFSLPPRSYTNWRSRSEKETKTRNQSNVYNRRKVSRKSRRQERTHVYTVRFRAHIAYTHARCEIYRINSRLMCVAKGFRGRAEATGIALACITLRKRHRRVFAVVDVAENPFPPPLLR